MHCALNKPFLVSVVECVVSTCKCLCGVVEPTLDCDRAGHDEDIGDNELAATDGVEYQPELSTAGALVQAVPLPTPQPTPVVCPVDENSPNPSVYIEPLYPSRNDF